MRATRGITVVCLLLLTAFVAGCGGGDRQDENEPSGSFAVEVTSATFPAQQALAEPAKLAITVRNSDSKPLPNVAVTVSSFSKAVNQAGLADQQRPVWIVDKGPAGGDTAFVSTWALGELAAGASKTFTWEVTAIQSGTHRLTYKVSPGLDGKANPADAGAASGTLTANVSKEPAQARVDPETGAVIRGD